MGIRRVGVWTVIALLVGNSAAWGYDYGWDAAKVQYHHYQDEGYYVELAQDPVAVVVDGTPAWEYVIDMYDYNTIVSGSTYEIRGFENDHILNVETDVTIPGLGTLDRTIQQFWSEHEASGDALFLPASIETDADDVWELTSETWALINLWHTPSDYSTAWAGSAFYHPDSFIDAGESYNGAPAPTDLIPIRNWGVMSPSYTGLIFTMRVVSTDLYEADDITWTPWNDMTREYPVMGDWVPEPATMSLLALGGLAVLRRRRR